MPSPQPWIPSRTALALLIAVALLMVTATPVAPREVAGPTVEHSTLPNGMTVVTERRPEGHVAGMSVPDRALVVVLRPEWSVASGQ